MSTELTRVTLANGIELDVIDTGPRNAPVLMFLHGFPESHRTWRHQIAHFSDRYRCIAPDQRGYRGSSKPEGAENYTPDKLIGDVFLLAHALGVDQFTVLGHDWGGAIAWGVALMGQGIRVKRAVIANAPHPGDFPEAALSRSGAARGKPIHARVPGYRERHAGARAWPWRAAGGGAQLGPRAGDGRGRARGLAEGLVGRRQRGCHAELVPGEPDGCARHGCAFRAAQQAMHRRRYRR